jgi:hypothetical protein
MEINKSNAEWESCDGASRTQRRHPLKFANGTTQTSRN